mmetsp:Transcript_11864/g.32652  ORF Transcript_11864/g.32652 Transcript_11864/m.32652 type:complete len:355 (-) Transcript_11864:480-1544(-)
MKLAAPQDIAGLANLILSEQCRSIALLTGAGVSVASGIPDFRSPGGMYDTLRPELLTATQQQRQLMEQDPTYVVEWGVFRQNAFPYLEVRRPFILGTRNQTWKPTIAHRFAELLHVKTNKLTRVYTQNIDGLDGHCAQLPADKIVSVHGTIGEAACEGCGHDVADFGAFCDKVETRIKDIYDARSDSDENSAGVAPKESTPINCDNCGKPLVKPKTVLFGRSLPAEFFKRTAQDLPTLDLLIVAGTSLVVSPANSLVYKVPQSTVRAVVNLDPVGEELGIEYHRGASNRKSEGRDFFAQGDCDSVFLDLIDELGWIDDLVSIQAELPSRSQDLLKDKLQSNRRQRNRGDGKDER